MHQQQTAIMRLQELLKEDMQAVNTKILEQMQSPIELIPTLASHIIQSGGKRLRPLLVLASSKALAYEGKRHIGLAASVEFIHTATLLHDDVVDESDTRRGVKTSNSIWGNKPSVLVGDFLFSRAFQLMVADGNLETLSLLANASATIAEGEVLQLMTAQDIDTTMETYKKVIHHKTAVLFATASQLGAMLAGETMEYKEALATYGTKLGMAFQMIDDILDYDANNTVLGKNTGDDFKEGKITLPIIIAMRHADEKEKSFWQRCIGKREQKEGDFEEAKAILQTKGYLKQAKEMARLEATIAIGALTPLPESPYKECLKDIVLESIHRQF